VTTSIPPRPSGGNAKYALIGVLLLLLASAAIWWVLRKPRGAPPVTRHQPPAQDASPGPVTPQVGTEIVLNEEPDAGPDAEGPGDAGRRVRYVYRYVSGDCHGQVDNDAVNTVARQSIGGMRECYNRALRTNPALRGNVHARWIIAPNGTVADIATSISGDQQFKSCFENALRRVHFPAPRGGCANADFNFPLTAN
jgi:hypothetical protein